MNKRRKKIKKKVHLVEQVVSYKASLRIAKKKHVLGEEGGKEGKRNWMYRTRWKIVTVLELGQDGEQEKRVLVRMLVAARTGAGVVYGGRSAVVEIW